MTNEAKEITSQWHLLQCLIIRENKREKICMQMERKWLAWVVWFESEAYSTTITDTHTKSMGTNRWHNQLRVPCKEFFGGAARCDVGQLIIFGSFEVADLLLSNSSICDFTSDGDTNPKHLWSSHFMIWSKCSKLLKRNEMDWNVEITLSKGQTDLWD